MKRIALFTAATIVLAGCGSGHPSSGPRHGDLPNDGSRPVVVSANRMSPDMLRTHPAQLLSPTRLAIVTTGSSSCPSVPSRLIVESPHTIAIHLTVGSWKDGKPVAHPPPGGACTADYGTTRMVITIDPRHIAVHDRLTIRLFYPNSKKPAIWTVPPLQSHRPHYPVVVRSPIVMPLHPAERERLHLGGFAQFVSPTRLAIVTWGSGSCPDVPDELVIRSPHSIEVDLTPGTWTRGRLVPHLHLNAICTTDLRTTAMLVAIDPRLIDVHHRLTIHGLNSSSVVTVAPLERPLFN